MLAPTHESCTNWRKCKSSATRMMSGYPAVASIGWLSMALGCALLGTARRRWIAAAGLLALGLGLAAWRVSSPAPAGTLAPPDHLGQGFLVVNGGLLLLGLALVAGTALREASGLRPIAAKLAIGLGVVLVGRLSAGLAIAAGVTRAVASAAALGFAGLVLVVLGRAGGSTRAGAVLGRTLLSEPPHPRLPEGRRESRLAATMGLGAIAVAAGPHLAVVFAGAIVAAWCGYFLLHLRDGRRVPVAPLLTSLLAPAGWLLATIAGAEGLSVRALPLIPMSPAAESLVAPVLFLAAWSLGGLWPLHHQVPGPLLAPIGGLLLVRIGFPLVPEGLEQWQPLAVPLLILGIWHAAARQRWSLLVAGAGLLGIVGLSAAGAAGGAWLLGAGLLLEILAMRPPPARVALAIEVSAWVASAWGGLLVLEAGLRSEVVYTAFGAAGLALILAGGSGAVTPRGASTPPGAEC